MENPARIVINLPASHRIAVKFKALILDHRFYGSSSLGSKRKSYSISVDDYNLHKEKLKEWRVTKAKTN